MTYDLGDIAQEIHEEIDKCYQKLVRAFLMAAENLVKNGEANEFLLKIESNQR